MIVSEADGIRKPTPEIFELACRELGFSTQNTVFIGDNPTADIDGANKLGMYTVYIPGNYGQTYEKVDYVCHNYSELVSVFNVV